MNVYSQHIVFFDPTPQFVRRVKKSMMNVVDVGAGAGFLAKKLSAAGIKVLAVDIIERENPMFTVYPLDATTMQYPVGALPIMARPCHNEWIEGAINRAMETVDEFWYVGLEKNFPDDLSELGRYQLHFEKYKAGKDGERVVRVTKPKPK